MSYKRLRASGLQRNSDSSSAARCRQAKGRPTVESIPLDSKG